MLSIDPDLLNDIMELVEAIDYDRDSPIWGILADRCDDEGQRGLAALIRFVAEAGEKRPWSLHRIERIVADRMDAYVKLSPPIEIGEE